MSNKLSVLIVDDEEQLRKSVASILISTLPEYEFEIVEAENGRRALEATQQKSFDLVLMDVRMPEMSGLEALEKIKETDPRIFVVIMTAHSNLNDAVTAIKYGAYDYLEKPVEPEKLTELVKRALETRQMVSDLAISNPIFDDDIDSEFVGSSQKMRDIFQLINKLSQVDTTVLIRGENGTGKELVAKAIHYNSPRKHGKFVAINCGAIPENLLESELFGHEKGAFTGAHERKIGKFQLANNGTIFLDEVGELRPEMQVKLLRVLQERKFMPVGSNREVKTNARVVAATNQNLEKMIEEGTFREDFFYRLNVMPIFMPPLRDRLDDLDGLAQYFVKKFAKLQTSVIRGIDSDALDALKRYDWPGNIRELENTIERAFIMESSSSITLSSLPEAIQDKAKDKVKIDIPKEYSGPMDFDRFKEVTEKEFIENALRANQGRINKTVAHANIPKNTLLRKIKKYGIDVKQFVTGRE
ncbi:MAG: sigma-54-dependent Fis family transcriptional regulator [Pseudobdellovibrionaceae bacterium]|nr:sigma-54-dependent Fis family transcriptional regulator [Bdellovibrionales bacterium]USN48889.1 MAG: sigma-54-dependent Fis family transcriptional regulator [Pseudobdellovibrionaceae bacterium]